MKPQLITVAICAIILAVVVATATFVRLEARIEIDPTHITPPQEEEP